MPAARRPAGVCVSVPTQGDMESCLVAAALNGVDRRSLQRSARLAREVLERARRRAVDWRSVELPKGSVGVISRELPCRERGLAAGPQRLLPGEVRAPVLGDQPIHSLRREPGHGTHKRPREPVLGGQSSEPKSPLKTLDV